MGSTGVETIAAVAMTLPQPSRQRLDQRETTILQGIMAVAIDPEASSRSATGPQPLGWRSG
jgi:hypothetical protein